MSIQTGWRREVAPSPPELRFYDRLSRLAPSLPFSAKAILVAGVATHVPLLALIVFLLAGGATHVSAWLVFAIALLSTLAGTIGVAWALNALLKPVGVVRSALAAYLNSGQLVPLPEGYRDTVGALMRDVAYTLRRFDEMRRQLEQIARHDALTGMLNRHAAAGLLEQERGSASGRYLALVDIDHFKQINDTYGHSAGDAVLRDIAQTLRANLREQDWAARWGGEEFLLVLSTDEHGAATALERLRTAIAALHAPGGIETLRITVSIGATRWDAGSASEAINRADAALYGAKSSGRNCTRFAEHAIELRDAGSAA
jgi:diguanylate cyclase (GGDEF)-like protein